MKTIKDLKEMIREPASKDWFKKHGSPKSPAADKALKSKIDHDETREERIHRINSAAKASGAQIKAKARHERRHEGGKRTTLAERKSWMDQASKDY